MKIAFNNFKKEYLSNKKDIDKAMLWVASSGWYILGKEVEKFEEEFSKFIGSKYSVGVGNGMEAIQIALMALDIKKGDEVITTSLSAAATALAIKAVGAKPVFADIDEFYHTDPKEIEKKITKKTKAIIPVHLYGESADMKEITRIAKKYKLEIIEDCAQAHGAEFNAKKVGTFGIAGAFSFYPTKNLGAYGDGGAITTDNTDLAKKMRMIRNYGQANRYEHPIVGINSRLDEMQAAILRVKLRKLVSLNNKRVSIAKLYKKELRDVKQIRLPEERPGSGHVYHLFVIESENRNGLQKYLKENGIDTLVHYPIAIHKQKSFIELNKIKLEKTEDVVGKILSLPCHPYLSMEEIKFVSSKIKQFYKLER